MKKKGFTLVELIAAIAILAITMTAISSAFITGIRANNSNDLKLQNINYAQSILESLKSIKKVGVANIYNNNSSFYLYFNNQTDLTSSLTAIMNNDPIKPSGYLGSPASEDYNTMFINKPEGSSYSNGAVIIVTLVSGISSADPNAVFKIRTRVCNISSLANAQNSEILREFLISR